MINSSGKILLISWHPGYKFITAGGLVRTREIVKRFPVTSELIIIDKYPSLYNGLLPNEQIFEYYIPQPIQALFTKFYPLERSIEWSLSLFFILILAVKLFRRQHIETIYVPNSEMPVISLPALLLHLLFKKRLVFCNGNVEGKTLVVKILLKFSAFLHNFADGVITYSEALRTAQIKSGITKPPIFVNGVGLDLQPYAQNRQCSESLYDLIIVGRVVKEKGVYDLPAIFQHLKKEGLKFKAVIVGEGPTRTKDDLLRQFAALGLTNMIEFAGSVSEADKVHLYYSSKICVFPSYVEGWGIVPQEAMAAGLPVVTYNLKVYQENIAACSSVFQVETGDVQAFAEAVERLLRMSDAEREQLGMVGHDFVKRFDWNVVAQREYEILTQKENYVIKG